jgi:hypothetical protein
VEIENTSYYTLFQIISSVRVSAEYFILEIGKGQMGLNLETEMATQILHHEHEKISKIILAV